MSAKLNSCVTLCLLLLLLLNTCHSAHITSFIAPAMVKIGETFWITCNFTIGRDERLDSLIISKNNADFYKYNESTKKKEVLESVSGVNQNQVVTTDNYRTIKITNAKLETRGVYKCTVNTLMHGTPERVTQLTHVTATNGSLGITELYAPKRVLKGDNYWINCSFALSKDIGLFHSLNISKDNQYFYNYTANNYNTNPFILTTVSGISNKQVDAFNGNPCCVRINNASQHAFGVYNCSLSWTIGNEVRTIHRSSYVSIGANQRQFSPYSDIIFILLGLGFNFVLQ